MNWLKGVIGAAIILSVMGGGWAVFNTVQQSGLKDQQIADLTDEIEQEKAARAVSEIKLQEVEANEKRQIQISMGYRKQLQAATGDCLNRPVPAAIDRLLTEITTPDGIAGVSARFGRSVEEATEATVEVWRNVGGRGSPRD